MASTAGAARSGEARSRLLWLLALVAIVVALVVGSQVHRQPTLTQRVQQVAAEYRCPVCVGENAAESSATEAVEMRSEIRNWLQAGRSEAQIRASLLAAYGPSILERPPSSGVDGLVWILPLVVAVVAVGGLGLAFRHWGRRTLRAPSEADRAMVEQALLAQRPGPDGLHGEPTNGGAASGPADNVDRAGSPR
jgi:cytochrome c-type biogenesis protein CcmH